MRSESPREKYSMRPIFCGIYQHAIPVEHVVSPPLLGKNIRQGSCTAVHPFDSPFIQSVPEKPIRYDAGDIKPTKAIIIFDFIGAAPAQCGGDIESCRYHMKKGG